MHAFKGLQHGLFMVLALASLQVQAQDQRTPPVRAGLWELQIQTAFDGQRNLTLRQQIAELPAGQREQVERLALDKGLPMDDVRITRACLSSDSLNSGRWNTPRECTSTYSGQSDAAWRWHSICPRSETDAEATFSDREHFTMTKVSRVATNTAGITQTVRSTFTYRWLAATCDTPTAQ